MRFRTFDSHGKLVSDTGFEAKGFGAGIHVVRRADGQKAVIESWSADRVVLVLPNGSKATALLKGFLEGDWKHIEEKEDPVALEGWTRFLPWQTPEWQLQRIKADVTLLILSACERASKEMKHLTIFLKPSRAVQAHKHFEAGDLVIPPSSHKIDVRLKDEKWNAGSGICVGCCNFKAGSSKYQAVISIQSVLAVPDETSQKGCVSPFWLLRTSSIEEECNLAMDVTPSPDDVVNLKSVKVPMAISTRPFNKGDMLVLYRQAKEKKQVEELTVLPKAKKPRKSE